MLVGHFRSVVPVSSPFLEYVDFNSVWAISASIIHFVCFFVCLFVCLCFYLFANWLQH